MADEDHPKAPVNNGTLVPAGFEKWVEAQLAQAKRDIARVDLEREQLARNHEFARESLDANLTDRREGRAFWDKVHKRNTVSGLIIFVIYTLAICASSSG